MSERPFRLDYAFFLDRRPFHLAFPRYDRTLRHTEKPRQTRQALGSLSPLPFFEIARILKCLEESQRYGNVVSEQHVRDFDGQ